MKLNSILVIAGLVIWSGQSAAVQEGCTVSDKEFLHQITSSGDWGEVHAVFTHNLPACPDEGLYADGYSNLVVGTMATRWEELDVLNDLVSQDDRFRQFIFRHISISAGEEDLKRVALNAKTRCSKQSAQLCREILVRCKRALGIKK